VLGSLFSSFKHDDEEEKNASFSSLEKGQARVFEREKEKWAAYCDEQGELHVVSATCTHLGCTVKWNNDEKSWDCPCHGSRYSYEGKVMNGPANADLKKYNEKKILEKK
jgi:Rieske Fe-S protein